ncbi:unnamed protein product [Ceutorhynchus assimilis]|uniref:Uncharacterized protein n=1 Tax=Ceutorhynchus assimilis TaxID=467358 RepID=A0A9N9MSR1_9CUCU|nr:unnamed protein product [Ceutorhynchus assimilis]
MEERDQLSNSPFPHNSSHYDEYGDIANEAGDRFSDAIMSVETSKSSIKYSGDARSEISVTTSILDDDNELKNMRKKLEEYEYKVKFLEDENEQINEGLQNERKRTAKLEQKLQFVKDNQEVFMRLKEAYINMKYNEAAGRKIKEIREKGVQTWKETICSSCLESEELRKQIEITLQKYSELFVVSPGEMEHLMNTVKYLKDLIDRREETWAFNLVRENKLQGQVALLEEENAKLRRAIAKLELNEEIPNEFLEDFKLEQNLSEERKFEEMQKLVEGLSKELEKLKKIIIKYEKRYRETKERYPGHTNNPLNEKETKLVNQILMRYTGKSQLKKNQDEPTDGSRSPSMVSERNRPMSRHRPFSPMTSSGSRDRPKSERPKSGSRHERNADSAIMMMDCLFE